MIGLLAYPCSRKSRRENSRFTARLPLSLAFPAGSADRFTLWSPEAADLAGANNRARRSQLSGQHTPALATSL